MKKKLLIFGGIIFVALLFFIFTSKDQKPPTNNPNTSSESTSSGPKLQTIQDVQFTQNSIGISADGYKITSVTYFESGAWALAVVEPAAYQAQASKMILKYDDVSKKWLQVSDPVEIFSSDIQTKVPSSLYNYLIEQKMILNHSESR